MEDIRAVFDGEFRHQCSEKQAKAMRSWDYRAGAAGRIRFRPAGVEAPLALVARVACARGWLPPRSLPLTPGESLQLDRLRFAAWRGICTSDCRGRAS